MSEQEIPISSLPADHTKNQVDFDGEAVFIDVETTGLNSALEYIVEIAALRYRHGKVQEHYCTLVKPPVVISEEVMRIHHISNEMVASSPSFSDIVDRFSRFIEGTVICGYNIGFDVSFLNQELMRIQRPLLSNQAFDVLKMARVLFPGLPKYSLGSVGQALGCQYNDLHRAYEDVCLEIQVFEKCLQRLQCSTPVNAHVLISRFGFK